MQRKTSAMVEAALMAALTCVFAVVGTYIPFLTFVLFFIPIPFIILGKRHGLKYVLMSMIASALLIGGLTEPLYSIFVVAIPGVPALVMGYMLNKEYHPSKVLVSGAIATIFSSLVSFGLASWISGISPITEISTLFKQAMDMQMHLYQNIGMEKEKIEQFKTALETTMRLTIMMIPSAIIVSSILFAYINYMITIHILRRIGYKVELLPPFKELRLPRSIIMGTLLIAGLTFITGYFKIVNFQVLSLNVFLIFQFIYMIQGFAVISYYMTTFHIRRPLKIVLFVFLIFSQAGLLVVAILGFMDTILNFRKIGINRE